MATRRAQWRVLGLTDEDMTKPKIAIVNSSSPDLAICCSHLDGIAKRAKDAIRQANRLRRINLMPRPGSCHAWFVPPRFRRAPRGV